MKRLLLKMCLISSFLSTAAFAERPFILREHPLYHEALQYFSTHDVPGTETDAGMGTTRPDYQKMDPLTLVMDYYTVVCIQKGEEPSLCESRSSQLLIQLKKSQPGERA